VQVGLQRALEDRERHCRDALGAVALNPGVAHQHVDAPERLENLRDDHRNPRPITHIEAPRAGRGHRGGGLFDFRQIPPGHHHQQAARREAAADLEADAPIRARDQRYPLLLHLHRRAPSPPARTAG
jgi:hypothetical protein